MPLFSDSVNLSLQVSCHSGEDRLVLPSLEEAIPGVESVGSRPKDRARFYTSRIREGYSLAQQLMIEKIRLESDAWEGLEYGWELGDVRSPLKLKVHSRPSFSWLFLEELPFALGRRA